MAPKKSLGQNFLTSTAAVHKIISAAGLNKNDMVLEVGPGRGVLTKSLLETGARVIAVEKDRELVAELSERFSSEISSGQLKLVEDDILNADPAELGLKNQKYKVVANIPYYITGQLLRRFLSGTHQPSAMILLLQKEVVDRMIAKDRKGSLLSVSVKAYGQPKKIVVVNRGSFFPIPKVDSAVVAIENISKDFFAEISEKNFFRVIKAGFAHKRKVLSSNLGEVFGKQLIAEIINQGLLEKNRRAEDLTLENWQAITKKLETNQLSE